MACTTYTIIVNKKSGLLSITKCSKCGVTLYFRFHMLLWFMWSIDRTVTFEWKRSNSKWQKIFFSNLWYNIQIFILAHQEELCLKRMFERQGYIGKLRFSIYVLPLTSMTWIFLYGLSQVNSSCWIMIDSKIYLYFTFALSGSE